MTSPEESCLDNLAAEVSAALKKLLEMGVDSPRDSMRIVASDGHNALYALVSYCRDYQQAASAEAQIADEFRDDLMAEKYKHAAALLRAETAEREEARFESVLREIAGKASSVVTSPSPADLDGLTSWAEAIIDRADERPLPSDEYGLFFRHAALKMAEKWLDAPEVAEDYKAERDEARREVELANFDGHYARAEAAEARVAELEAALRQIAEYIEANKREGEAAYQVAIVARAALRSSDKEGI